MYASIRVHEHRDPGPADDLWSAFYCILRILGVKFPWDKIKIPPKVERLGEKSIIQCYNQLVQETGESDPVDATGKVPKTVMEALDSFQNQKNVWLKFDISFENVCKFEETTTCSSRKILRMQKRYRHRNASRLV